ncbi:MAG: large conductance mechanosensitive channel protein MscL [Actinomycetota bacterium]|nr:large conductance mechanosensitive channel protein MscL [Actinomycetota bacterium]
MLKDFKDFILRGNVVDLAIAFVVGTAFAGVVKALVADMFTPLLAIPGHVSFASLHFTVNGSTFHYGDFINTVLEFVVVAAAMFFFVVRPVTAVAATLKKRKGDVPPETKECPECLSTIPYLAHRCAQCTAEQPTVTA